ncbi:MAG: peptide deformylase [Spirochaetales bacterium]|uniref:peptide deformylase n=1 Tax=Bullifex sp. TaxID=2815808 RepID=UPI002A522F83|nr:peptide deformylase [Bullifex sp.]MDD5972648.1 peptide deformylase [Spirochaetales bacterium]MDD7272262.1 peptide deformylase [Spirochaetales bacterium]MDY4066836.1 peptide deformylase [Bullifex sp.]
MLDIYKLGEDVLYTPTEKVKKFDSALKMLIDAMFDTMDEADGVGLAGPQVGVSQKLFVVDDRKGNRIAFINPEIIETSVEVGPYEEGCLSVPGVYHDVIRPLGVTVQAQDVNGKAFTIKATGLLARIIQHENDHLNAKLFIDRLSEDDRAMMVKVYERKNKTKKRKK